MTDKRFISRESALRNAFLHQESDLQRCMNICEDTGNWLNVRNMFISSISLYGACCLFIDEHEGINAHVIGFLGGLINIGVMVVLMIVPELRRNHIKSMVQKRVVDHDKFTNKAHAMIDEDDPFRMQYLNE